MSSLTQVAVHSSQFPENVRRELFDSFRRRRVNHKFHYDTVRQARRWQEVHEAFSPARQDSCCAAIYEQGYEAAARRVGRRRVHVIGLGCGDGRKDTRLLQCLAADGREVFYSPCDVSLPLVLAARQSALEAVAQSHCFPLVCDLAVAKDLRSLFENQAAPGVARLFTFFGMIPNFEPQAILPKLASLVRARDHVLFSANLAPGGDYTAGMRQILPQYDNALTRNWLMQFLLDHGVNAADGDLRFGIEAGSARDGLKRVTAHFQFSRARVIRAGSESFRFLPGNRIRLFYSYRYTPNRVRCLLKRHRLAVLEEWITPSEQEGVFLVARG